MQVSPAFAAPAAKKVDPFQRSQEQAALFEKLLKERGAKLPALNLSKVTHAFAMHASLQLPLYQCSAPASMTMTHSVHVGVSAERAWREGGRKEGGGGIQRAQGGTLPAHIAHEGVPLDADQPSMHVGGALHRSMRT